jgi:hypothetical protein
LLDVVRIESCVVTDRTFAGSNHTSSTTRGKRCTRA